LSRARDTARDQVRSRSEVQAVTLLSYRKYYGAQLHKRISTTQSRPGEGEHNLALGKIWKVFPMEPDRTTNVYERNNPPTEVNALGDVCQKKGKHNTHCNVNLPQGQAN